MDDDQEAAEDSKAAMWTYIWVMVGFKVVTAIFLLYFTHAWAAVFILIALHIPWIAAALFLLAAPGTFYFRLLKQRRRRAELLRQEFMGLDGLRAA